ncbi:S-adenosylmethionine:tRNA ribosyltransferase-isomerase [Bacteroidia bacterium]|nr:S-adenosylmethionine:tRNA ribosyltransferase-isomerase [Bacteroidia bacterium]
MQQIYIHDFHYNLPEERIAKFPASPRDASKLLVYKQGQICEDTFCHLANHLPAGALLVFNNTKVIPARLLFHKTSGAAIEIFCLTPCEPVSYEQSLQSETSCVWHCMVGNLKRWRGEDLLLPFVHNGVHNTLIASKLSENEQGVQVRFQWLQGCRFAEALAACGTMPLPPYLHRAAQPTDYETYQTVYAQQQGSVAAPTAGLHFTERVFNSLKINKIQVDNLTLHVGAGTFLPVKTATVNEHSMHAERFVLRLSLLENLQKNLGKVYAVGTTSARTLESIYWMGCKLLKYKKLQSIIGQWEPYEFTPEISPNEALEALANYLKTNNLQEIEASTSLIIVPTYRYKIVCGLLTNFHQPQSTLLLLVSALIGNDWQRVYDYALQHQFRFLSYGDSSLLLP